MIKVYGVPSCDKIKKTLNLFEDQKIEFEFINLRQRPLLKEMLRVVIDQLGINTVLNTRGMIYRKKGLKDKNLSEENLFIELFKDQGMIKRPLIENQGKYISGYDQDKILNFVK